MSNKKYWFVYNKQTLNKASKEFGKRFKVEELFTSDKITKDKYDIGSYEKNYRGQIVNATPEGLKI